MARGDINQRIRLVGGDEVQRGLADIGRAGERTFHDLGAASGRLNQNFGGFQKTLGQVQAGLGAFGGALGGALGQISGAVAGISGGIAGIGAAAAAAVAGLALLAAKGAAAAAKVDDGAQRVGTSAENYQKLGFAFEQSGASADEFEAAMGKILEAAEAGGEAAKPFEKLGVSLKNAAGNVRDPAEVFADVAEKIAAIEDPTGRSAKAVELFGRRIGTKLVQPLSAGRDGLKALGDEADRLGVTLSAADIKIGAAFDDTIAKLGGVLRGTTAKLGLSFAPAFTEAGEILAQAFGAAQPAIVAAAQSIAAAVGPVFVDLANLIAGNTDKIDSQFLLALGDAAKVVGAAFRTMGTVVGAVLTSLGAGFRLIADTINSVFGTKFTAGDIPAFIIAIKLGAVAIGVLTAAFVALRVAALANPITAIITAIAILAAVIAENWPAITAKLVELGQGFNNLAASVKAAWDGATTWLREKWDGAFGWIIEGVNNVIAWFEGAFGKIRDAWTATVDWVVSKLETLIGWYRSLVAWAEKAASAIRSATSAGGPQQGAIATGAHGGRVVGPGTSTSDSIFARLSAGEYVVQAAAVRRYGVGFLHALNRMALPAGRIEAALRGFSIGGLVDGLRMPVPAFAMGGAIPAKLGGAGAAAGGPNVRLELVMGGKTFGPMMTEQQVVDGIRRYAVRERIASAGRAPSLG